MTEEGKGRFELEKVIVTGEEFNSKRREEHIAYSNDFSELMEKATTLPLKGGRYRHEWFAIIELDENGEIIDHAYEMFADDWRRKK